MVLKISKGEKTNAAEIRRKCLERIGYLMKWKKETRKRQLKNCNVTLAKKQMKAISRVEYRDNRMLIQVKSKVEVERVITKENEIRFKLAYSSLILNGETHAELGFSGEGFLTREILGRER